MGIFNVQKPIDSFAAFDSSIQATLAMQSICLLFTFSLFFIRLYQVIQENKATPKDESKSKQFKLKLLQISHLSAMFLNAFYIFMHFWNYIHFFISDNPMPCSVWFIVIIIVFTLSKNFIYIFLMLRSSLAFEIGFFRISLSISISVIAISCISQWMMGIFMLSDFTPDSPFPDSGFCFRVLGPNLGAIGISGYNLCDAIAAFIALLIFWRKARFVKIGLIEMEQSKNNGQMMTINEIFKKHILLGVFILSNPIILFFLSEFLRTLMGIVGALTASAQTFYIFMFFKQNASIYNRLCCQKDAEEFRTNSGQLNISKNEMSLPQSVTPPSSDACKLSPAVSVPTMSVMSVTINTKQNTAVIQ